MTDSPSNSSEDLTVRHPIDVDRLHRYLLAHIPGFSGPLHVEQFKGGQSNPTYRLVTDTARYVLRRKPPGKLLSSAHAVDREYRVMTALAASDVPVGRTRWLCEDPSVIGTPFYVMDFVEGRVFWDPAVPGVDSAERRALYRELNRVIAALHSVDYTAIGLEDFGRPGSYFMRQITRWTNQYRESETQKIEAMDRLIEWLPEHVPAGEQTAIVHGDFRLDNVIFHPREPRILAVLDWELSTLGHPLADFAYHCMTWRLPQGSLRGLFGCDLSSISVPSESEYVRMYCERSRREVDPDEWEFCLAFNMFRLSAILQGIRRRVIDGTAASPQAQEMGHAAGTVAKLAWDVVEAPRRAATSDWRK